MHSQHTFHFNCAVRCSRADAVPRLLCSNARGASGEGAVALEPGAGAAAVAVAFPARTFPLGPWRHLCAAKLTRKRTHRLPCVRAANTQLAGIPYNQQNSKLLRYHVQMPRYTEQEEFSHWAIWIFR